MTGPGETQLEVDRRRVRERISMIKKSLLKVNNSREIHRQKRQSVPIPTVSIIGYTNTGKSTLFNTLANAKELAENKLFATLDPKTKKLKLPSGQIVLLSDTVGFIRNLPHQLIESFKSTFEEVAGSDLLIHVIDASHPNRDRQMKTVDKVLQELDLHHKPIIRVMNKMDQVSGELCSEDLNLQDSDVIQASGLTGLGLDALLKCIEAKLSECYYRRMQLLIPHQLGHVLSNLYTHGCVINQTSTEEGSMVDVNLSPSWQNLYEEYSTF